MLVGNIILIIIIGFSNFFGGNNFIYLFNSYHVSDLQRNFNFLYKKTFINDDKIKFINFCVFLFWFFFLSLYKENYFEEVRL